MKKEIFELYDNINKISAEYALQKNRKIIEEARKHVSQIQDFALWFLEKNKFGLEMVDYQQHKLVLLEILNDIVKAMENNDKVLMHDALDYGLLEFIKNLHLIEDNGEFLKGERHDRANNI